MEIYLTSIPYQLLSSTAVESIVVIILLVYYRFLLFREYNGSEPVFIDAFSRGVRRSYIECCSMINRPVPEVEVADPMEVAKT